MDNIKESKEYKLAKEWEMAVNSFSFNPKRFAAAIPDMHPTLQQSLYRLLKEIFSEEREVICFRLLTAFNVFSNGRVTLFSISEALAPG